jgi:hypothetical protein
MIKVQMGQVEAALSTFMDAYVQISIIDKCAAG